MNGHSQPVIDYYQIFDWPDWMVIFDDEADDIGEHCEFETEENDGSPDN